MTSETTRKKGGSPVTEDVLELGSLAIKMIGVNRALEHPDGRRENNAEHSYMLSLVAMEIAAKYFPQLDRGLTAQYATIHDLVEIIAGDTLTFGISEEDLQAKYSREAAALVKLKNQYKEHFPHLVQLIEVYEAQSDLESRFVRAIDKCLPSIMNLHRGGDVMSRLYGVNSAEDLEVGRTQRIDRFNAIIKSDFPELLTVKQELFALLSIKFFPTEPGG